MIWPTSPGSSVIAPSASSARPLSPVAEGPFRRRTGSGPSSIPRPFGRSLRAMGCSCCVRPDRSCSRSARGRRALMPHSYNAIGPRSKMRFETRPDRVGRAVRNPRPGLAVVDASPSSPRRLLQLHGQPAMVCAQRALGGGLGRRDMAPNHAVSSAASNGRSVTTSITAPTSVSGVRPAGI